MMDDRQLETQRKSSDRRTLAEDDQRPVKKPRIVNDVDDKGKTDSQEKLNQKVSIFIHTNTKQQDNTSRQL